MKFYSFLQIMIMHSLISGAHDPLSSDLERSLRLNDGSVEIVEVNEMVGRPEVLVLPKRIPCECPGEIFIILREDVPGDSVVIEFITENEWIRIEPDFWNQKVRFIKALDFPAGFVNVNIYCGGDIKATVQIEYYSTVGELEQMLQKVADPIAFACQAFKFSSAEKMDSILTLLLKSSIISHGFSSFPNEVTDHDQETDSQLEELPTLFHCAAKFGLKKLAGLLLQDPKAIQACSITNKYGENPAHIAKKYGQKEIWKVLKELPISEDKNTSGEKEINAEDDIYVFMMSSDSHSNGLGSPSIEEPPGACLEIQKKKGMNADAELEEYNEEGMVEKEEGNKLEENACHLRNSLYSNILRDVPEVKSENISFSEGPPLPPRNQFLASKQNEFFYLYSALKKVEGQVENKGTEEEPKINDCCDEIDEEDPYTSAEVNDGVYDAIMENKLQEQRKDGRSFIMNRPPAPAPRPLSAAVKEEGTSYIAQVFQQKVTRTHAGNEKLLNAVRKPDRSYEDKITYTTVKPNIPPRQEEHILFQQQLKKGNSSMDDMQKLKLWQIHTSKTETTQQVMDYFKEQLKTDEETGL
ncbi:B-cell scaffold protein with ankyrin repeats isoform X2 [Pantherophis guttatus]|uniref:B-cell scaffold protein with ankyrin repeats isoform X2 n=1 Tax=Pantherophis guttatus TaxID=94885 RepID=A0A6P9E061_PANGU|nr:B-cell scaffold protein with ankyrin repeats isoform X2 [Pantherophis guttatus]